MKAFFKLTMLAAAIFCAAVILWESPTIAGLFASLMVIAVFANVMPTRHARLCVTLSVNEILADTIEAFSLMPVPLEAFSTDLSSATAVKDQQIIAHIASLPAVQSYDATTGFKANAATASSLLTDVPVTLDQLKHVPVKVAYLTQLASKKNLYLEAVRNYAYVLKKSIVDYALTKVIAANFSNKVVAAAAASNLDTIEIIRGLLNTNKAAPIGRFGIVSTAVAAAIQADTRIASSLYYAQLNGGNGFRQFKNISGFEMVWEYPDLPSNGEVLTGFFGDRRAVAVAARVPDVQAAATALGIGVPSIASFQTISDPGTGFTLLGIAWQEQGTFDYYVTIAALYGATAGKQGGANSTITDNAGVRLATA